MQEPDEPQPPSPIIPLDDVPALIAALDQAAAADPATPLPGDEPPGRILRLQLGYNPNSSSLGTSVVMLLWGMGALGILLQAAAAVILSRALPPGDPTDGGA